MFAVVILQLNISVFQDVKGKYSHRILLLLLGLISAHPLGLLQKQKEKPDSRTSDYFSLKRRRNNRMASPTFMPRVPSSPVSPATPSVGQSLGSSSSSRGSWSNIFTSGTVRHLIGSSQEQNPNKLSPTEFVLYNSTEAEYN